MKYPKNFTREEFKCPCGCGGDTVDYELMAVLQEAREHFGKPINVTSGYRCKKYNKKIGGSSKSQHITGRAADIQIKDVGPQAVWAYFFGKYRDKFGIGKYPTFTHIDTRAKKARWHG